MHPSLQHVAHRPWVLPSAPWGWRQTWHDLAFLHWRVAAAAVAPLIPRRLALDLYDGSAWIAVTPFWMSAVTLRGLPALGPLSTFAELNVRTYVRQGDRPGVWFFSLDASSQLAVWAARRLFHLPYETARMAIGRGGSQPRISYWSRRRSGAEFAAIYEPAGPVQPAQPGTLEHFLTERYCLYSQSRDGRVHVADIHHAPWPLQEARARVDRNDLVAAAGLEVTGEPLAHYAARLDVVIWAPRRLPAAAAAPDRSR